MSRQYAGTTDLIWQPDLRISTFPSGLILAQRSAVGRVTEAYTDGIEVGDDITSQFPNVTNDGGIYVFPTPQRKDDPVFSTFDVSGYGRVSAGMAETYSDQPVKAVASATLGYNFFVIGMVCRQTGVIQAEESTPLDFPATDPTVRVWWDIAAIQNVVAASAWIMESATRTNFGRFDEITITWSTGASGSAAVAGGTISW